MKSFMNESDLREHLKYYKEFKDQKSADVIINEMQGLIGTIAKSFKNYERYYDFVTEGVIGVLSCIKNFDLKGKTKFSSFAYFAIRGKILDSLFENSDIMNKKQLQRIEFDSESSLNFSCELLDEIIQEQLLERLNIQLNQYDCLHREFVLACADKGGARTKVVEKYNVSHSTVKYHANKIEKQLIECFVNE